MKYHDGVALEELRNKCTELAVVGEEILKLDHESVEQDIDEIAAWLERKYAGPGAATIVLAATLASLLDFILTTDSKELVH